MKELHFEKPRFLPGTNFTVRIIETPGDDWGPGQVFEADGKLGIVSSVLRCKLKDLDKHFPVVLMAEHDPECRTHEGLLNTLRQHHGDWVNPDTVVTCLGFTIG